MPAARTVGTTFLSRPAIEGAGVSLRRAFGADEVKLLDPFLMLDDFRGDDPDLYMAGFPWHPHRGIETITYMLEGEVEHADSLGNRGSIRAGDVQWMTAGSGIIHQEMPLGSRDGCMGGFQLWANLPAADKMTDPRYRGVESGDIPEVSIGDAYVRVICGEAGGAVGPVRDVRIEPTYLDVRVRPGGEFTQPTPLGHTAFAYVISGAAEFGPEESRVEAGEHTLVLFEDGDGESVECRAGDTPARFLLVSGRPLREPVAWRGPIVMNTDRELREAFEEYRDGTFVKSHVPSVG